MGDDSGRKVLYNILAMFSAILIILSSIGVGFAAGKRYSEPFYLWAQLVFAVALLLYLTTCYITAWVNPYNKFNSVTADTTFLSLFSAAGFVLTVMSTLSHVFSETLSETWNKVLLYVVIVSWFLIFYLICVTIYIPVHTHNHHGRGKAVFNRTLYDLQENGPWRDARKHDVEMVTKDDSSV